MRIHPPISILLLFLLTTACTDSPTIDTPKEVTKAKLLQLVNDARSKGCTCGTMDYPPAPPLTWNNLLEAAAQAHSEEMSATNQLTHKGNNGSGPGDRIEQVGYIWGAYGENIAEGYTSEEEVIRGWLESAGHCKNILDPSFTEMGVATSGTYWTQVLGAPR